MIVVSDTSCISNLLSVGPEGLLDRLETEAGFRLRVSLKIEALRAVGEAEPER